MKCLLESVSSFCPGRTLFVSAPVIVDFILCELCFACYSQCWILWYIFSLGIYICDSYPFGFICEIICELYANSLDISYIIKFYWTFCWCFIPYTVHIFAYLCILRILRVLCGLLLRCAVLAFQMLKWSVWFFPMLWCFLSNAQVTPK